MSFVSEDECLSGEVPGIHWVTQTVKDSLRRIKALVRNLCGYDNPTGLVGQSVTPVCFELLSEDGTKSGGRHSSESLLVKFVTDGTEHKDENRTVSTWRSSPTLRGRWTLLLN